MWGLSAVTRPLDIDRGPPMGARNTCRVGITDLADLADVADITTDLRLIRPSAFPTEGLRELIAGIRTSLYIECLWNGFFSNVRPYFVPQRP